MVKQSYYMIKFKDLENEENKKLTDKLQKKNESLCSMIRMNHQINQAGGGIRSDILSYLAETAEMLPDDMGIRNSIATMTLSEKFDETWYSWAMDYFLNDDHMDVNSFDLIISTIKDTPVTLDQVQHVFNEHFGKHMDIVKGVKRLLTEEKSEEPEPAVTDIKTETAGTENDLVLDEAFFDEEKSMHIFPALIRAISTLAKADSEMITKMTSCGADSLQKMHQILDDFFGNQLSGYAAAWEHDKKEIVRLNEVVECQEQFIEGQQKKINELSAHIEELNEKLRKAEKEREKNEQLAMKIKELQKLTQAETFSALMSESD